MVGNVTPGIQRGSDEGHMISHASTLHHRKAAANDRRRTLRGRVGATIRPVRGLVSFASGSLVLVPSSEPPGAPHTDRNRTRVR